ncbi:hypothetical protein B481_1073 [Planococcus halocryophilus Or1]|nr:hypothetical protein B481_1073 [Planococcus halocryophilus Or1]
MVVLYPLCWGIIIFCEADFGAVLLVRTVFGVIWTVLGRISTVFHSIPTVFDLNRTVCPYSSSPPKFKTFLTQNPESVRTRFPLENRLRTVFGVIWTVFGLIPIVFRSIRTVFYSIPTVCPFSSSPPKFKTFITQDQESARTRFPLGNRLRTVFGVIWTVFGLIPTVFHSIPTVFDLNRTVCPFSSSPPKFKTFITQDQESARTHFPRGSSLFKSKWCLLPRNIGYTNNCTDYT